MQGNILSDHLQVLSNFSFPDAASCRQKSSREFANLFGNFE